MGLFDKKTWRSQDLADHLTEDWSTIEVPTDPDGPLYGPLAEGLALGAPMANGSCWNSLNGDGPDPMNYQSVLRRVWGIKDGDYWIKVLNALLDTEYGDSTAFFAAELRTRAKLEHQLPVLSDEQWHYSIDEWLRTRGDLAPTAGAALHAAVPEIRSAEDTLRGAQLLGVEEEVVGLDAYDLTRAVAVARWGVNVGYGPPEIAANTAVAARDIAAAGQYASWRDFGLAFAAGRIVTYPETWGRRVADVITMLRPLLDNPQSPWRNIDFPTPRPEPTGDPS